MKRSNETVSGRMFQYTQCVSSHQTGSRYTRFRLISLLSDMIQ